MDKVAKFIFHGGTELERAQAETEYTAGVLGTVLEENDLLRRIIYKLQMPASANKFPPEILNADELAAYKAAVVANL